MIGRPVLRRREVRVARKTGCEPVLGDRTVRRVISGGTAGRVAVGLLGFAAFAVGTCELVLAGVLPGLSSSFGVPVSVGGQVVTVFGLTCAFLAPALATATAR